LLSTLNAGCRVREKPFHDAKLIIVDLRGGLDCAERMLKVEMAPV